MKKLTPRDRQRLTRRAQALAQTPAGLDLLEQLRRQHFRSFLPSSPLRVSASRPSR